MIPVINLADVSPSESDQLRVANQIGDACATTGFFHVLGHGVPNHVVTAFWSSTEAYFDLPLAEKKVISMSTEYMYGYSPVDGETLARSRGEEAVPDRKESFCIGPPSSSRRWPTLPGFQPAWEAYYQAMEGLATRLLRAFARALKLKDDWFSDKTDRHESALRALRYPLTLDAPSGKIRASQHTDYGTLTILRAVSPGLQVCLQGNWVDVPVIPAALLINVGDLMEVWRDGAWRSTLHRVVVTDDARTQSRTSAAFFHNVNADTLIQSIPSCLRPNEVVAEPFRAGDFLRTKHSAAVGY